MPTLSIDGQSVSVPDGATILEAARQLGIEIPTLCHREGLAPQTSCMVCVVRVDGAEGLVPSCATQVRDGMVVESETEEVHAARRMALELLLSDHRGDCHAPCQLACPAGLNIPVMIRQIVAGDRAGAIDTVTDRIPLPAILGRICPAPCEGACRRGSYDEPVAICLLKRWVGDEDLASGEPRQPELAPPSGSRVAIVGAGPAGLSAAYYLRRLGHEAVILDEREGPGGGLREIDPDRLPGAVLEAEAQRVLDPGVELRSGVRLGKDVSLADLRADFDAVLLAVGEVDQQQAEELGVPFGRRGLEADRGTHESPLDGVFVAGSALSPSRLAVRAVGAGREAAEAIDQHLRGQEVTPAGRPFNVSMGRLDEAEAAQMAQDASERPRITPSGGQDRGFNDEEATREGLRCLHCDCRALSTCRLKRFAEKYEVDTRAFSGERRSFQRDATHPAVIYEPGKCIACGLCVQIARKHQEELGLTFVGRGFDVRTAVPFDEPLAEGLKGAARECAEACPTGALVLRDDAPASEEMAEGHD
ncbi:MAG: 2Fe-2S iron-sulfur cluster-binding protein [Armatimonadota bacterium]|nr:2Fe-2S iron-sulfur cluster-binding protein [Armatimonadota bacterium]